MTSDNTKLSFNQVSSMTQTKVSESNSAEFSTISQTNSTETLSKNLILPSNLYYNNPIKSVRSLLGNDVTIINTTVNDIILHNNNILVNVEYSTLDFNAFELYEVLEVKSLSTQSNKYVATKIKNLLTSKITKTDVILNEPTNVSSYIFIKCFSIVTNSDISYYGIIVKSKVDCLHSYSSIFDTQYLSYHGTNIKHIISNTSNFSSIESDKVSSISSKPVSIKPNKSNEVDAFKELKLSNNNFNLQVYDTSYLHINFDTVSDIVELKDYKSNTINPTLINVSSSSLNDLVKAFNNVKGLILVSKFRVNPCVILFVPTDNVTITVNQLENLSIMLEYDLYNLNCGNFD